MSPTSRAARLTVAGLAVAALGLTGCSTGSIDASNSTPSPSASTSETPAPQSETASSHQSGATSSTTAGASSQQNNGFDGAAFQKLMAATSVPATSATTGALSTGAGRASYTMLATGNGIGRIECSSTAHGGSDSQSDHDALAIASPFLEICGSYPQYGVLKEQATQYVRTNLPTLQGESKVSTTVGAVGITVGRAGPGNYVVTIIDGG